MIIAFCIACQLWMNLKPLYDADVDSTAVKQGCSNCGRVLQPFIIVDSKDKKRQENGTNKFK